MLITQKVIVITDLSNDRILTELSYFEIADLVLLSNTFETRMTTFVTEYEHFMMATCVRA